MNTIELSGPNAARRCRGPKAFAAILLATAGLFGCARYDVVETNGIKLINVRKPERSADGSFYTVKLGNGQNQVIPAGRVMFIVPHGDSNMVFRD